MSLIKNLKRREIEVFGAKRVIRNDNTTEEKTEEKKNAKKKQKKEE